MKAIVRTLVASAMLAVTAFAPPVALGSVSCHEVNASGVGQDLGGGTTIAQISDGGLLQGSTAASFVITGVSGNVASFQGTITFTTNRATLTANVVGTLDLVTGAFSATTTSVTGTGKLAGATGSLVFSGVENLTTGAFTEVVTGEICADLAP